MDIIRPSHLYGLLLGYQKGMGVRRPFSGGRAEESLQLGKVRVQEHRDPRSLGFLARARAGITQEAESAGLGRDWRFVICRRLAWVAEGAGDSTVSGPEPAASRWGAGRSSALGPSSLVRSRPAPTPFQSQSAIGGGACRSEGAGPRCFAPLVSATAAVLLSGERSVLVASPRQPALEMGSNAAEPWQ